MLGFLIIFGVVSLFVGLPIATGNLGNGRKRFVKSLIKTIAFVGVISGMLYVGIMLSYKSDVKIWNNGQHENCGQWEMFDVEKVVTGQHITIINVMNVERVSTYQQILPNKKLPLKGRLN